MLSEPLLSIEKPSNKKKKFVILFSILFIVAIIIGIIVYVSTMSSNVQIYGTTPSSDYVLGKFDPETSNLFEVITVPGTKSIKRILRKEVALKLQEMYEAFKRDYPNISFDVISATRNYDYQKQIWNYKWFNDARYKNITDPLNRALGILQYSSMPGTSRHHWGTDIDIYSLEPSDFESGNGLTIYNWLKQNAITYGFGQPFTSGRCTGYYEEKWHWSYLPLAKKCLQDWVSLYDNNVCNFLAFADFEGAGVVGILAPIYVKTINEFCK